MVFDVRPGTYTEQISIGEIANASATNTITFKSSTNDSSDVILTYTPAGSSDNFTVELVGTDYITFRDMTLASSGTEYAHIIYGRDGTNHLNFLNNRFIGSQSVDVNKARSIYLSNNIVIQDINIENNYFLYNRRGIYIAGSSVTPQVSVLIRDNYFEDVRYMNIGITGADSPEISGNEIFSSLAEFTHGIYVNDNINKQKIFNNKVNFPNTTSGSGINIGDCIGTSDNEGLISNNFIRINCELAGAYSYGIYVYDSQYQNIYNNSVHQTGTMPSGRGIYTKSPATNVEFINNIIANIAQGYCNYIEVTTSITMDYNDLFTNGSYIGFWDSQNISDLSGWQSATGQEYNSISVDPEFFNDYDLHASNLELQSGTPLSSVTDDIDGESRDPVNPCMGADEFVYGALAGEYMVGPSSADFQTFNDAVNALKSRGVRGEVTFNVESGTYTEQISIPEINGISDVQRVTFQSQSLDSTDVILRFSPTSNPENYTILLDGADYFTFRKLTLATTGTDYARVVTILNKATNNKFENNFFLGISTTSTLDLFSIIYSYQDNDSNNIFMNNLFEDGSYGIYLMGDGAEYERNTEIRQNEFKNQYKGGIYLRYNNALLVRNNHFSSSSTITNYVGINGTDLSDDVQVLTNTLALGSLQGGYGIYLYNCIGTADKPELVSNNYIQLNTNGNNCTGIYLRNSAYNRIYYNSVIIDGSFSNSQPLNLYQTNDNIKIQNNILSNYTGSHAFYSNLNTAVISDYNNLFTTGSEIGYWEGISYSDLDDWRTNTSQDINSLSVNPDFVVGLEPHFPNPLLNDSGTPVAEVTDDIDGEMRDATAPDIGADEFCLPPVAKDTTGCTTRAIPDLTASGSNIRWYGDGELTTLLHSGSTFTSGQTDAGTYTYYATQTVNESESRADTVTLNIYTTPGIPPATDETICYGEPTPDLAAAGTDLKWYDDEALTSQVGAGTSYASGQTDAGVYPYYVTQTADGCESDPDTSVLTIHSIPAAPASETFVSCFGSPVPDLSAVGEDIHWYSDEALSSLVHTGDIYSSGDTLAGDYPYFPTQTVFGCESDAAYDTLRIKPRPAVPVADSQAVCYADNVPELTATGDSLRWYEDEEHTVLAFSGTTFATGKTGVGEYPYYVTQTVNGCESLNKPVALFINALPDPVVIEDQVICEVDTQEWHLGSTAKTSHSYAWTGDLSSSLSDPVVKPAEFGTYRYFLTETIDSTGCQSSDSVFITVHPDPDAEVLADQVLCSSEIRAFQIGAAAVTGNSCSWVSNPAGYTSSESNPTVTPTSSISYTLTETVDATGCSKNNSVSFTINPNPYAYVTGDQTICQTAAKDFSLGGTAVAGNSYAWTSSFDEWTSAASNPVVHPTDPGTYTYTLTETIDATDCKASNSVTILINPNPVVSISPVQNPIDQGSSTNLNASGAQDYVWSPASGLSDTTDAQVNASPTENTTYYLEGTNQYGCKDYDTLDLWVWCPACTDEDPFYSAEGDFGLGCTNNLYRNNLDCSWTILPSGTDSVYLHFIPPFDILEGDYVRVYNGDDATAPVIGEYNNGNPPPSLIGAGSSMFIRFVTDGQDGGLGFRAEWSDVPIVDMLDEIAGERFRIYPNPAGDKLFVVFDEHPESEIRLFVYNQLGKIVLSRQVEVGGAVTREELDVGSLRSGIYMIRILGTSGAFTRQFIKE